MAQAISVDWASRLSNPDLKKEMEDFRYRNMEAAGQHHSNSTQRYSILLKRCKILYRPNQPANYRLKNFPGSILAACASSQARKVAHLPRVHVRYIDNRPRATSKETVGHQRNKFLSFLIFDSLIKSRYQSLHVYELSLNHHGRSLFFDLAFESLIILSNS